MKNNQSIADIDNATIKRINIIIEAVDVTSTSGDFDSWRSLLETWYRNIYPKLQRLEDSGKVIDEIDEIVVRVNSTQQKYNLAMQEGETIPNMASNLHAILTEYENKLRELFYRCFEE